MSSLNDWINQIAEGDTKTALTLMREAADTEDSVDKHPVTPGSVRPARELLGDMLVLQKKPTEAIVAYQASLATSPNRFNSLFGAGRASELAGNTEEAKSYYQTLAKLVNKEATRRDNFEHAQAFLDDN